MHNIVKTQEQSELGEDRQMPLWSGHPAEEDGDYLSRQIITYIGNKRALLGQIGQVVDRVKRRMGKERLRVFDVFSGSGIVSRYLKAHASTLISNDIEDYAAVVGRCYLRNRSTVDLQALSDIVGDMNRRVEANSLPPGFIEELYAPRDESRITGEDRVFYTRDNARRLDGYRRMIDNAPEDTRELLLAPLLSEASIHSNTAGVFKGFYKNRETKIGQFGGTGSDALVRIKGRSFSNRRCSAGSSVTMRCCRKTPTARLGVCGTSILRISIRRTTSIPTGRTTSCLICSYGTRGRSESAAFRGFPRNGDGQATTCGRSRYR